MSRQSDAVDRALKGKKLTRLDVPLLAREVGFDKADFRDLAGVLEGDAAANGIRVYPAIVLNQTGLNDPLRYVYARGEQIVYKWSKFNLIGRDDVYAFRFHRLLLEHRIQLLRVLVMRRHLSPNVSYSLWPAPAAYGPSPKPAIDVPFQDQEFMDKPPITTLGETIDPKPLIAGIETADVLGADLLSDADVATLLSVSRSKVQLREIAGRVPPAVAVGNTGERFWVKSIFFNSMTELAENETSPDRLIDLNGAATLAGGDTDFYRVLNERRGMPTGREINGRMYWRESEILQWIGRDRKEVSRRTYTADDLWDFDDLARYLNRRRDMVFELAANKHFPKGVQVGDELFWRKADVLQWFADLELESLDALQKSRLQEAVFEWRRIYFGPKVNKNDDR